ncbi:DUF4435 domain-containing protein [Rhizobium rhizogenes]|uniref:DUF4435 domain-containing protein n=1 Tax=Rhizobium rhizogenes TaxID=359 RepID=UPI0022BE2A48|nr:DUF4435 domain-containing protein [Rhizobium rhizogenes]MCZ7481024.1 DUF4435 domain-containing protein [Rhizobium rhizogenes]
MSKIELSVDELVATIKKSSVLNIIIEGRDDVIAYRNLEEIADVELNQLALIISAGGRNKVLQIHDALLDDPSYGRCIFVCDQDFWVFKGIPSEYRSPRVVTTDGYSIESDLFRDYNLYNLLKSAEKAEFNVEFDYFKKWFAYRVAEKLGNDAVCITTHVNEVIEQRIDDAALQTAFNTPGRPASIHTKICSEPEKLLRGKSYLALYVRKLNASDRKPKHSSLSLFEHAVAANGPLLRNLEARILEALRSCTPAH